MPGSVAYRNIRYAEAERFGPASLVPLRDLDVEQGRGPVSPQHPSRFETLMGPQAPLEQAEHCQMLSVFSPGVSGKRPVMVWFHGGANITGGGELPWYDGSALASEQDVVVVSVTSRLGALGYVSLGAPESPSPATTDHLAAIDWVHRNIGEFGGDPENITLFGQSAGGFAIEVVLRWGLGAHVKGAIIQSGCIKQDGLVRGPEDAARLADAFTALLSQDAREVSVEALLEAQVHLARQQGTAEIWAPTRPETERRISVPIVTGWTRDDMLPFILMEEGLAEPQPKHLNTFADRLQTQNRRVLQQGAFEIAREARANGQRAWLYEFSWTAPQSSWGASHCVELPFLLGSWAAWRSAPMLRGADAQEVDQQGRSLRAAWATFARNHAMGREWRECQDASVVNELPGPPAVPSTMDSSGKSHSDREPLVQVRDGLTEAVSKVEE